MAKSGKSQFAILGMLALLKESTGYDLKKHMESSTQYFWKETFSSIYPVLEDLENQKLIVRVKEATKKNDRKSNTYRLTSEGQRILEDWLMQPAEAIQLRNELLLKLFFGNMVSPDVVIQHLEAYKKELKAKLIIYQENKNELSKLNASESLYSLITLDHGIRHIATSLRWCDDSVKILKSVDSQNIE